MIATFTKECIDFLVSIRRIRSSLKVFLGRQTDLTTSQREIVGNIEKDGIAVVSPEQLGIEAELLDQLNCQLKGIDAVSTEHKPFFKYFYASGFANNGFFYDTEAASLLRVIATNPDLNAILVEYFDGLKPSLRYAEINETNISDEVKTHRYSQLWHRDNGGCKVVKLFIYLNDVTTNDGPFEFVRGSQVTGENAGVARIKGFGARTTPSIELRESDASLVVSVTGQRYTCVLCDTTGVHRGGRFMNGGHRRLITLAYYFPLSSMQTKTKLLN